MAGQGPDRVPHAAQPPATAALADTGADAALPLAVGATALVGGSVGPGSRPSAGRRAAGVPSQRPGGAPLTLGRTAPTPR